MGVGCPEYILLGLPPRRRGKVSGRRHKSLVPGITPAWAGKRADKLYREIETRDHPRVGGEKMKYLKLSQRILGSPPRRRGKDFIRDATVIAFRNTPA